MDKQADAGDRLVGDTMNTLIKSGLCLLALAFAASAYAADLIVLKPQTFANPAHVVRK